jgi:hypothetical protein
LCSNATNHWFWHSLGKYFAKCKMPKQSLELNQLKHWIFSKSSIKFSKSQMNFQLQHDLIHGSIKLHLVNYIKISKFNCRVTFHWK